MKFFLRRNARFLLKVLFPKLYFIEKEDVAVNFLRLGITNSVISDKAKVSAPSQISGSKIGDYSYIAWNAIVSDTTIGKFCSIGPNLMCGWGIHPTEGISTSPAFYSTYKQAGITFSKTNKVLEHKPIHIGNDVLIGMNVTILDGVSIGDGAVIGAGAVVTRDVPPYAISAGSPAKTIKYRFEPSIIEHLLSIKWWDFDHDKLQDVEKYFFNMDEFIKKHKVKDV